MQSINQDKFSELKEIMEDEIFDVLSAYLEDAQVRLVEIQELHAAQKPLELAGVAHTLKGSSLNVGADRLGQLCSDLDLKCRGGEMAADAAERIQAIKQEYLQVKADLGKILP